MNEIGTASWKSNRLADWKPHRPRGAQDALASAYSKYTFNYPIHSGLVSWQAALPGQIVTRVRIGALERYARDAEVVTRHNQLQFVNYEAVGRTLFGLESNSPLF